MRLTRRNTTPDWQQSRNLFAIAPISLTELTDDELLARWAGQQPADSGTSPEQDELAAELERRGQDF